MSNARIDGNFKYSLIGASSADGVTPTLCYVDPVTHRLLIDNANTGSSITIGTSTITGGTTTRILYDNNGVVGEYTLTGTGTVVTMATSPSISGATITTSTVNGVTLTTGGGTTTFLNANGTYSTPAAGTGTVTSVSVVTANGISGSVATATTTPAITLALGAITPTVSVTTPQVINTVNAVTVTSNAGTVPITSQVNNFTNSSASAMTITMAVTSAVDGQKSIVRIYDASAATKGITWVGTENSTVTAPATSAGSTTIPLTVGFIFNGVTSLWTCVASA